MNEFSAGRSVKVNAKAIKNCYESVLSFKYYAPTGSQLFIIYWNTFECLLADKGNDISY